MLSPSGLLDDQYHYVSLLVLYSLVASRFWDQTKSDLAKSEVGIPQQSIPKTQTQPQKEDFMNQGPTMVHLQSRWSVDPSQGMFQSQAPDSPHWRSLLLFRWVHHTVHWEGYTSAFPDCKQSLFLVGALGQAENGDHIWYSAPKYKVTKLSIFVPFAMFLHIIYYKFI